MVVTNSVAALAFGVLVATQTSVALLFKLGQSAGGSYTYSPASAQTTAEALKLCLSLLLLSRQTLASHALLPQPVDAEEVHGRRAGAAALPLRAALALRSLGPLLTPRLLWNKAGLAVLYCFNNQLAFALFRWADAASITLIKSASSIVSALLLWTLLRRPIAPLQWHAIALQVLGLFIVQFDSCKGAPLLSLPTYLELLLSMLCSCSAGVWNEYVLKNVDAPMHLQNVVLYSGGVFLNACVFLVSELWDGAGGSLAAAYFRGYHAAALGVILCQAVLGLVVTAVLKYADNVVRSLATACSIAVLYAVNITFLDWSANLTYIAGCVIVFVSSACGEPRLASSAHLPSRRLPLPADGVHSAQSAAGQGGARRGCAFARCSWGAVGKSRAGDEGLRQHPVDCDCGCCVGGWGGVGSLGGRGPVARGAGRPRAVGVDGGGGRRHGVRSTWLRVVPGWCVRRNGVRTVFSQGFARSVYPSQPVFSFPPILLLGLTAATLAKW